MVAFAVVSVLVLALFLLVRRLRAGRKAGSPQASFSFDLSPARERYRRVAGLDDETARRHEAEFRRFFAILATHPRQDFGLDSKPVDAFWHELICCTSLYRDYCHAVCGRFVDHDPKGGGAANYARTWDCYIRMFGAEPDGAIWPAPQPEALRQLRTIETALLLSRAQRNSHLLQRGPLPGPARRPAGQAPLTGWIPWISGGDIGPAPLCDPGTSLHHHGSHQAVAPPGGMPDIGGHDAGGHSCGGSSCGSSH